MTPWDAKLPPALDGIKGICFDCYGTLFEITDRRRPYEPLIDALPREKQNEFRSRIMREDRCTADWPAALGFEVSPDTIEQVEADIAAEVASIRFRPMMKSILETLRSKQMRLGICSNAATPYYQPVVERLPHDFEPVLMSCHNGLLKPEAAIYEVVIARMGPPREDAMIVGDTQDADIEGPKQVGMKSMYVDAFVDLFRTD